MVRRPSQASPKSTCRAAAQRIPSTANRASDARSNRLAGTGGVFLLLLDDLHVSVERTAVVRREARAFVRQYVQPGDVVAVLRTSGGRGQDFTEDMALVENAITAFSGRAEPTATMQRLQGRLPARPDPYDGQRAMPGRPETTLEQSRLATDALQTIVNAAALLETAPGRRKAMLYFSEGVAISLETKEGQEIVSMLDRAWTASARANLTIYPIDPRRLTQGAEDSGVAQRPRARRPAHRARDRAARVGESPARDRGRHRRGRRGRHQQSRPNIEPRRVRQPSLLPPRLRPARHAP